MYNMVVSVMAALKSQPETAYALQLDVVNVDSCGDAEATYNVNFTDTDPCDTTSTWALVPVDNKGEYKKSREGSMLVYGDLLALVSVAPASDDLADITSPPNGDESTDLTDSSVYETSDVAFLDICGENEDGFQYDTPFGCNVRVAIPNNNESEGFASGTVRDGTNMTGVWKVMPVDSSVKVGDTVTFNSGFVLASVYVPTEDYGTQYLTLGTVDEDDTLASSDYADVGVFTGAQPLTYFNFVAPCTEFTMSMDQATPPEGTEEETESADSTVNVAAATDINVASKTVPSQNDLTAILVGSILGVVLIVVVVLFLLYIFRVIPNYQPAAAATE
jgi:hypothetical protein